MEIKSLMLLILVFGKQMYLIKNKKGIIQIPIILGLVIMAVALPIAANLVQKNTENRSKAASSSCSTTCPSGKTHKTECPSGYIESGCLAIAQPSGCNDTYTCCSCKKEVTPTPVPVTCKTSCPSGKTHKGEGPSGYIESGCLAIAQPSGCNDTYTCCKYTAPLVANTNCPTGKIHKGEGPSGYIESNCAKLTQPEGIDDIYTCCEYTAPPKANTDCPNSKIHKTECPSGTVESNCAEVTQPAGINDIYTCCDCITSGTTEPVVAGSCGSHSDGSKWCEGSNIKGCSAGTTSVLATCSENQSCDRATSSCKNDEEVPSTSCTKKSLGDANCDGKVNENDYNIWIRELQKTDTTVTADFNSDGAVDGTDFSIWNKNLEM